MDTPDKLSKLSINNDAREMLVRAREEGIETVWDRLAAQQPQCGYCSMGVSCRNCAMGPCRVDPFGEGPQKGVCGADADIIVARNLGRTVAAGASAHSDHGRDILEVFESLAAGETSGYEIRDEAKLLALAKEWGIEAGDRSVSEVARDLADAMMEDFGSRKDKIGFLDRLPEQRRKLFEELSITPRGIDRENVEMLHRTHMGVDNDYANTSLHALRTSLSDGWGGSMIATELSDVMFGTPKPVMSRVNLGALRVECVNIALHGHNPMLSDVIMQAAEDPELVALAKEKGAEGINLVGLCCTGNELQMRKGLPMVGNHLMQELVLLTGALDAMVVDYQCIMPSVTDVAKCFHTEVISTADKARFAGATHISFDPKRGLEIGKEIVRHGIEAYANRNPDRVQDSGRHGGDDGRFLGRGDSRGAGRDAGAARRGHQGRQDPRRRRRGRLQQPEDSAGLRPRHAYQTPDRERHPRPRDGLFGDRERQGRADAAGIGRHGRARALGSLQVARHSAGAAHGFLRGQHAHPHACGRARQLSRRGRFAAAAGRCGARVVLGEGRVDRRVRRRERHLHGARRAAADLRQPERRETAGSRSRGSRRREVRRRAGPGSRPRS